MRMPVERGGDGPGTGAPGGVSEGLPDGGMPVGAEGFAAFYRETLPRLYGYLVARCGDVSTAEELTQETYLAFVRDLRAGKAVDSAAAWLFGIARHKLVDHYRRRSRLEAIGAPWDAAAAELLAAPGPDALAEASRERVAEALARLPERQRIVVALRHLDGLAVAEIAAELGTSEHAVESLLARGRANLRRSLGARHPDPSRVSDPVDTPEQERPR